VTKLALNLLIAKAHHLKDTTQRFWSVVTNRTATDFKTVEHYVILRSNDLTDIFLLK